MDKVNQHNKGIKHNNFSTSRIRPAFFVPCRKIKSMSTPFKVSMSFINNHEEREEAKRLGFEIPDMTFEHGERWIFKAHITYFNACDEGIRIDFVSGDCFIVDHSDDLWKWLTS